MSAMLSRLNKCVREVAPATESFTYFIVLPLTGPRKSCAGDWFVCSRDMDIAGMDFYSQLRGEEYYASMFNLDWMESAAAATQKHIWCIETVCRTHKQAEDYKREMVVALGSGYKGVNYSLWRADLGGPEVQLGGMIWNNRTKTDKYDKCLQFNRLIGRIGSKIASYEIMRNGVAILHSLYVAAHSEAVPCNFSSNRTSNMWYERSEAIYKTLKQAGVTGDFIEAEQLENNPLKAKLLLIPVVETLIKKEQAQVSAFAKMHAVVLYDHRFHPACGETYRGVSLLSNWCYRPVNTYIEAPQNIRARFRIPDLLSLVGIRPALRISTRDDALGYGWLDNAYAEPPYFVACVLNINVNGAPAEDGVLSVDETQTGEMTSAVYVDRNREIMLPIVSKGTTCEIHLPVLDDVGGAFVFRYKKTK